MAKVRAGRVGRLLLIIAAVVLALSSVGGGGRERAAAAALLPEIAADGRVTPRTAQFARDSAEHPEPGVDRCRARRGGRFTAAAGAPSPPAAQPATAGPARTAGGPTVTGPLTGRRAVPLSRSGELPVRHGVVRC
ncbi:hypothetical protein [Streptomyces sp. x-80]|uniref:hypothetical protein n=1 Tax=Streptomyces sp. x-80 TaxID=2789282 RepID=UPI00397F6528